MSYGVGQGIDRGVRSAAQMLMGALQYRQDQQRLGLQERRAVVESIPRAVRGTAGLSTSPEGSWSPAQALEPVGRNPNLLTMDQRMAGVTPDQLFDASSPATLLTASDIDDIRSTNAPRPQPDRLPAYGSEEHLGQVAVGQSIQSFRKEMEDVGNNFVSAQRKLREVLQKLQRAKQDRAVALQRAATATQGNSALMLSDPHVQAAHRAYQEAMIDQQQALNEATLFGRTLKRYLPNLDLTGFVTMEDIGRETYKPNPTPAQFLTPGRNPAIR